MVPIGRSAAVLIPVIEQGGTPHLLVTRRADGLDRHAGEMSFPGGSKELRDSSLMATATREAHEEIGLQPEEFDLVGRLDDVQTSTGFTIRPFVGQAPAREYVPDGTEIVDVIILPVPQLTSPEVHQIDWVRDETGRVRPIHAFAVDEVRIWGATGAMVAQLLAITTNWRVDRSVNE